MWKTSRATYHLCIRKMLEVNMSQHLQGSELSILHFPLLFVCAIIVLMLCNYLRMKGCHYSTISTLHSWAEVCRRPLAIRLTTHDTQPVPLRPQLPPETWQQAQAVNNSMERRWPKKIGTQRGSLSVVLTSVTKSKRGFLCSASYLSRVKRLRLRESSCCDLPSLCF